MTVPAIGIDLGTTFCCAGVWRDGHVDIIPNDQGARTMPSYVSFAADGRKLVGQGAKNQAAFCPQRAVYDVKRLMGKRYDDPLVVLDRKTWPFVVEREEDTGRCVVVVGAVGWKPEELSAMLLSQMKADAERFLERPVDRAVITVPAHFDDAARTATKEAAQLAGLTVLRIINEPTAAALAFGLGRSEGAKKVLVFDCGGGTFDVTLLSIENGLFEVLATGGDVHLGGQDFDLRLVEHCSNDIRRRYGRDLDPGAKGTKRLRIACERAKRSLSSCTVASVQVEALFGGDEDYALDVTRAKFESLCEDLFCRCISIVDQVLMDGDASPEDVDDVVLVGGSTRIPALQRMLSRRFRDRKPLCRSLHPDEAVAQGAAIQAAMLDGRANDALDDVLLLDVCPLSVGLETAGGVMTVMIPRNTTVPATKTSAFTTFENDQEDVEISIYEGERTFVKDNHLLGRFELTGIAPAPRGVPQIQVTFEMDADGVLNVSAIDKRDGRSRAITVRKTEDSRLDTEEIRRHIETSMVHRETDREELQKVETRLSEETKSSIE